MPRYDVTIRSMIARENELTNYRVTWLTSLQGLLFAALGFAWDKKGAEPLVYTFSALGVAVAIVSLAGLLAASNAIHRLWSWWEQHKPPNYEGPDVVGLAPRTRYANPMSLLPILFLCGWVAVGCVQWFRPG